jgi:hypothetical protein
MIAIINRSENHGREYGKGAQNYEILINTKHITNFEHKFEDGLSLCLSRAALAVDKWERDNG